MSRPASQLAPPPVAEHMDVISRLVLEHYGCTPAERVEIERAMFLDPPGWHRCTLALWAEIREGRAGRPTR